MKPMKQKSSGVYVIDEDYNVVSCNDTIKSLYPQLKKGEKCYHCLMNLDEPCPPCPVANHIHGPKTYMDPIRGINETVDAVDMELEDGRKGHALVLSTVGERAMISTRLPSNHDELTRLLEHEYYDTLTDSCSRKGFIRDTELLFQHANPTDYAMVLFDLRNFKALNDIFGIKCGDEILKFIFNTLRESWIKPVVSSRLDADCFLFLTKKTNLNNNRLESLLEQQWKNGSRNVHLHLRCGVYLIDDTSIDVSHMIDRTILANETVDSQEQGSVAIFDSAMHNAYVNQAEILSSFQSSLKNGNIKVYFQPIVRTQDGKPSSAEALIRWHHPELGLISPADFIPALEKNGLISELDHYVLKQVYQFQKSMQELHQKYIPVSINLSRQDFYNDDLMNDIFLLSNKSGLMQGAVNYEVTETSVAILKQSCFFYLSLFQKNGSKILLDDFGTGFSSLGMLGRYPLDVIKIDKSFIDRIETQPIARSIVASIIEMCHKAGLATVAKGVENLQQNDFLKDCHCDYIQGYFYAKPMDADRFREYLIASQDAIQKTQNVKEEYPEKNIDLHNLLDLIDHDGQYIQACSPEDYHMIYANQLTREVSGHPDEPYQGKKCYEYMMGLNAPCGHCPLKQMGTETEKSLEVDDGNHVFALTARLTNWNGKPVFIEYGREVTNTKEAQLRYASQIRAILESIPEGQGVFHMDLTADKWISSGGPAQNARNIQNVKNVDELILRIGSFVPDEDGQKAFFQTFSRGAQLNAYQNNRRQIVLETKSYYDDRSIRWSRITTQLIDNPGNGHVESIIYGVDISKEKKHIEELETEKLQSQLETEHLQEEVKKVRDLYSKADHDRRYDFLTGLYSRLNLYDVLQNAEQGKTAPITALIMLDLDNFKLTNDKYGHAAGDQCLHELGKKLLDFGIVNHVSFFRYGGDEFIGLIQNPSLNISELAAQLIEELHNTKITLEDGTSISLTASIGYTDKVADTQEMIKHADHAMYLAKNRGKDQIAYDDFTAG